MSGRLAVGIVGAGHIARAHLAGWRRAGCRVVGVYDLSAGAAAAFASRHRVERVFDDLDALLAAVEVADVCTPPASHAPLLEAALERGRHVLVEKPVVIDPGDWERLRPLLARDGGRLAALHNLKYSLGVLAARRWVEQGRIGELLRLERQFLTDPATDRMLRDPGHWSAGLPGGRWFESLPHELYLIHAFLGPLDLLHAAAVAGDSEGPAAEVQLTLSDGRRLATVSYSARCRLNRRTLTLVGTDGVVVVDLLADSAALSTRRDARWKRALGGTRLDLGPQLARWLPDRARYLAARLRGATPHARLIAAFARHLRGEGPAPTPLEEIDYVIRMNDRIGRALEERR